MKTKFDLNGKSGVVRAYVECEDAGFLEFDVCDDVVVINRTHTLPKFEGQGVAKKLVEDVTKWAEETGHKIKSVCSFAKMYFKRHPEHQHLLAEKC